MHVDFHGDAASVEEHGMELLDVNKNHICLQTALPQEEWWNSAHCMYPRPRRNLPSFASSE